MSKENKFQSTTNEAGFFKEYFKGIKKLFSDEKLNEFEQIKSDEERVRFVKQIVSADKQLVISLQYNSKNEQVAAELKAKGNKEFAKNDDRAALKYYSESILHTSHDKDSGKSLSIIYANRSAALYHLNEYQAAIEDIEQALSLSYPQELRYKVQERKAKCLLALRKHQEALQAFRHALQALDDSKLVAEKKLKMQTDVQIMMGILTKPTTKLGHVNALLEGHLENNKKEPAKPKLCSGKNKIYESGCDKFQILENEVQGRYASATQHINPGDVLAIEKSYCSVVLAEHNSTNCQNCFRRTNTPYPCSDCSAVIFCSKECKRQAESSYHKYECKLLNTLINSGASVMVHMALRIMTQSSLSFFLELKNKLQEPRKQDGRYISSDYLSIYNLVRHEDKRGRDDFLERTVMALFLLQCLQKVGYFDSSCNETADLTDEEYFIAGLILRHLQLLQFNAHEISELELPYAERIDESKSIFVGGGIFPTLALFNHSCDPGVNRYFLGKSVVVRAVKTIRPGEVVAENYGPMFTLSKRDERRKKLDSQYWFVCNCMACEQDWPILENMDKAIMRFRCDAKPEGDEGRQCNNAIAVRVDTDQFMAPCLLCGKHMNVLKGLKVLQDTDAMFRQASKDTDRGQFQAALDLYLEILKLLDSTLVPPFLDYHLCQQAIRKCMLALGNKYIKDL